MRGADGLRERGARRLRETAAGLLVAIPLLLTAACVPEAPTGSGAVTGGPTSLSVAWTPPENDASGGQLGDLAGYRLYYARSSPVTREDAKMVEVGDTTRHTVTGLEPGVYFVGVTAVDTAGNESDLSGELRVELADP